MASVLGRTASHLADPPRASRLGMTDKLNRGVVEILTPIGPRYLRLTFWQRLYFLWMFRNFSTLPQQVLSRVGVNMIERLPCAQAFDHVNMIEGLCARQ